MAFGGFHRDAEGAPMAEINMIPLIDVMLVLLVIFIITAPLLTHAVKIDLPRVQSQPNVTRSEHVALSIDEAGAVRWNGESLDRAGLEARMAAAARQSPQPELHIHADRETPYRNVAEVLAAASRSGLARIGFVSDPSRER
ncbi:MAG: biopolymer transporter ExbD [Burkholderiales bacterium]|nr:biopolymer transporter ExbD [Burkholderiales bacterium]